MKYSLKLIFLAFCLSTGSFSIAQTLEVSGKILSKSNQEPVPFATISVPRQKTGTSADENGFFSLEVRNYKTSDYLQISSVGYNSLRILLGDLSDSTFHTFELEAVTLLLEEQVVRAEKLDPGEIVARAAKNRKKVISTRPYFITAVYNEELYLGKALSGAMQGYGMAYIEGYREKAYATRDQPQDQIQWKQIRRTGYTATIEDYTPWVGAHKLLKAKDLYLYDGPVSTSNLSGYIYDLDSITTYNNDLVYRICFESKSGGEKGELLIHEEDYSILSMVVTTSDGKRTFDLVNKKIKPGTATFSMSMSKIGRLYYLNALHLELQSKVEGEHEMMKEKLMMAAGQVNQSEKVTKMNPAQKKVLFHEMINPKINYSESFWGKNPQIVFPQPLSGESQNEFLGNHGKRIVKLPKGFDNYQDLYNDRQLIDQYFLDY